MQDASKGRQTLKTGVRRTVRIELDRTAGDVVVKRFHAPGALQGRRDRRRAERELACLERLTTLGLPVPEPLGVRLGDGPDGRRWELVTRYLAGATSLRSILDGVEASASVPWPAPEREVLDRLGAALARAHARGLDHPDLHAGNVLVDRQGRVWLVDLAGARVRKPDAARAERDLVRLAADLRERVDERARARILCAWRRASAGELAGPPLGAGFARRLERAARERRRHMLARQRKRWTRESGACVALVVDGHPAWLARGLDPEPWLARVSASPSARSGTHAVHGTLALRGRWRALRETWYAAARLSGHGLPSLRPALLVRGPQTVALFAVPIDARPVRAWLQGRPGARPAAVLALGTLAGGAHDRGLAPRTGEPWLSQAATASGPEALVAGFGPVASLARADPGAGRPDAWLERLLDDPTPAERAAFRTAWVAAHRAGRDERRRLAQELGLG